MSQKRLPKLPSAGPVEWFLIVFLGVILPLSLMSDNDEKQRAHTLQSCLSTLVSTLEYGLTLSHDDLKITPRMTVAQTRPLLMEFCTNNGAILAAGEIQRNLYVKE